MRKLFNCKNLWMASTATALLTLVAGCATSKPKEQPHTFFPLPPDQPRIQYLTSFGSESDLRSGSSFAEFVVGGQKMHRPIWKPYGISATKGTLYVCDTQPGNLAIVDLVKRKVKYLRPAGRDAFQTPINVAVDTDGTRYVTDPKRGEVLIYGSDDRKLGEMGRKGESKPCGIAIDGARLYVTDLSNHCVRVYDKMTHKLLLTVPRKDGDEKSKLHSPTNVAVDQQGKIYVSDTGGFATKVFDAQGNHVRTVGELGLEAGRFALPKGIAVDRAGRTYVVDAATAVVQMFDSEGQLLMYFGEPKSSGPGALYLPAGIAVDYENIEFFKSFVAPGYTVEHLIFVTNQAGPNKVSVYGFLKKS